MMAIFFFIFDLQYWCEIIDSHFLTSNLPDQNFEVPPWVLVFAPEGTVVSRIIVKCLYALSPLCIS